MNGGVDVGVGSVGFSDVDILSCSRSYRDRFIPPAEYLTGILTRAGHPVQTHH